ncbi:flagellar hook-length control protein FliK [Saccharophagus degradans]|uniref:Flagellar hook-length control protein-like C-terminal domain-containing protein n=1 Tax=Saccharophagus degradans (strain 2-40 / ATCC 43961 / DSM 17024) TaxID=203122 RepID=Q21JK4_SACD2|nr:flagellar hook-length control protein FliK [Saccharophagus degradans]ABD81125.1 hypothetical protein Sde_1865 [Saccharophagus degradans 2-40]
MDAPTNKTDIGAKILSSLSKGATSAEINPTTDLKPGTVLKGVVEQIKPITAQTANQLLAGTASEAQAKPANSPYTNAQKTTASLPPKIEALLRSVQSNLNTASQNTAVLADIKIGRQTLPIVTNIPLKSGDAVLLTSRADGTLNLDPKLNNLIAARLTQTNPSSVTSAQQHPSDLNAATSRSLSNTPTNMLKLQPAQMQAVTAELNRALPQQQPLNQSLQTLNSSLNILREHSQQLALSTADKNQLIKLVNNVINKALDSSNPITGQQVLKAIQNSGQFLESKLANSLLTNKDASPTAKQATAENIANSDTKSLLFQTTQASSSQLNTAPPITEKPQTALDALLKQFMTAKGHMPEANKTKAENTQRLLTAIAAAAQSGLARIRSNQLQQLLQMDSAAIDAVRTPPLALELPIKLWDYIFPLHLSFQEKWRTEDEEEKEKNKDKKQKRKSYWTMFMEFELDNLGKMAAEVKVQKDASGDQVMSTLLWAESEPTRQKIRKKIHTLKADLENTGITVNSMECSENAPPINKRTTITQSLIDITT